MLVKDKEIMKEEGGNYRHFYKDNIKSLWIVRRC